MAKLKPRRSKKRWLALLIIPIAAAGWFLTFQPMGQSLVYKLTSNSCASPVFTTSPTVRDDFGYLVPLGNINPPDHTLPTDHIYYVFPGNPAEGHVPVYDVQMPGDVYITRITYTSTLKGNEVQNFDYKLDFSPCGPVDAYYDHIHVLSPKLAAVFGKQPPCEDKHPRPDETYRYCSRDLHFKMAAGELVGQAGGAKAAGFDLGVTDKRAPKLAFVNPSRIHDNGTICPFDLFADPLKSQLEAKFEHSGPGPVCGEIMQDVASTLAGDWFFGSAGGSRPEDWQNNLALVHDNRDTTKSVVAVGGKIGQPISLFFHPVHSGTLDRDFKEVQPGDTIYCYQAENFGPGDRSRQHAVIQLVDAAHLKIELQTGNCVAPYTFSSPTTYER